MGSGLGIIVVLIAVAVLIGIIKNKSFLSGNVQGGKRAHSGARRHPAAAPSKPPEALGVPSGHSARPIAERIEAALSADFEARVKDRVLKQARGLSEGEWQWRWFELKRYFLLCAVLRGVPMYSRQVDDVWHEMLMFTREYEQFCRKLCGSFIHHAPHAPGARPDAGERAWFDWVYGELFIRTQVSDRLWGRFYRTPLPRGRIAELETMDAEELRRLHFNSQAGDAFPDIEATIRFLIDRGRMHAADARGGDRGALDTSPDWSDPGMMTGFMSGPFFHSSLGPDCDFDRQMEEARPKHEQDPASSCGSSFYGCDGGSGGDDGSGGGGESSCGGGDGSGGASCSSGDGGGSSCGGDSSCGGGCGGGGGD